MQEIMRLFCFLIGLGVGLASLSSAEPARIAPRPLAAALYAMEGGRWDVAARLAERDGPAASALIEWYRLSDGQGTPGEVAAFLDAHSDWPGLDYLRRQSEERMAAVGTDSQILAFFDGHLPQTGAGALAHARALLAAGRTGEAEATLALAWLTMDLSTAEHDQFIARHADLLAPHHDTRLDMALWRGLRDVAQMVPLVSENRRKVAETRQQVEDGKIAPDDVPEALQTDPLVAHALFDRHLKGNDSDKAIAVILRQSRADEGLGEPGRWAGWRRYLARAQMREGNAQTAYDLASRHGLVDGSSFADLEWLSGYLALTYLDDPALALDHFQRFRAAVETPISLGRAGYWIGRAQEALGDPEAAQISYARGAAHQTSFYGLLAAEKAGLPADPDLAGDRALPDPRQAAFTQSLVYKAAILALASDELNLAERFFVHLSDSLDATGLGQLGAILAELDQPHLQVMIGKAGAQRGIVLPAPYYALHLMTDMDLPVPMELALSIARRESEFDHRVVSGAGAMGLMQLMPGTAGDMARALGETGHSRARVFNDWRYNVRLGSTYLAGLAERFDGNVVMMAAGYNAGPGRPRDWMEENGDPRSDAIDVVDWIEHIPFRETRNYVMRVAESLPVYRARIGKPPHPVPFSQELTGATLRTVSD
ncbi:lytic transglycosylase domain-containing protein [uncultured Roseovarius sp.]|uniref:lytic transglycosylase domain-containing protein n=1 Tax=uncultured Roseovarius sp. TaxID=293344 RepID=UPI0025996DD6|nr:lytic transglycosylase domain-containing protein [uncultured Roseovarius sp.]